MGHNFRLVQGRGAEAGSSGGFKTMIKGGAAFQTHSLNVDLLDKWAELAVVLDFLYGWIWYCTFTFRDHPHPETANKAFVKWAHILNRRAFGVRYHQRGQGVAWMRGEEPHRLRETIHYHALVGGFDPARAENQFHYMDLWNDLAGFARIYPYNSNLGARYYISKYCAKGGHIDLWYPDHMPPGKNGEKLPFDDSAFKIRLAKAKEFAIGSKSYARSL